eukprot:TRINITY_DN22501_c0_g1_i1.p1 TRINITY_DN22501_c0_g1~~TRINITY_DN22501_c0_g1_i1.p1  ORF type:complete len:436 (+),score=47.88 TRINITY_DN22501_c0_g1_i1:134-1441(+)
MTPSTRVNIPVKTIASTCREMRGHCLGRLSLMQERRSLLEGTFQAIASSKEGADVWESDNKGTTLTGAVIAVCDRIDVKGFVTGYGHTDCATEEAASTEPSFISTLRQHGASLSSKSRITPYGWHTVPQGPPIATPYNINNTADVGGPVAVALGLADFSVEMNYSGSVVHSCARSGITGYVSSRSSIPPEDTWVASEDLDSVAVTGRTASDIHNLVKECFGDRFPDAPSRKNFRIGVVRQWGGHTTVAKTEIDTFWDEIRAANIATVEEIQQPMFMNLNEFKSSYTKILQYGMHQTDPVAGDYPFVVPNYLPPEQALFFIKRWTHYMRNFMQQNQLDIIATPTSAHEFKVNLQNEYPDHFNYPFVISGNPVVTIPINKVSKNGLPLGVQLIGSHDQDIRLLAQAQQLSDVFNALRKQETLCDADPLEIITKAVSF